MVVEAERTQRAEVEAALDLVEACPNLQLLLNRAVLTANDTFGAYGGYDAYAAPPGG
jgi:receptor protein-tyrosine kinase